MRVALVEIASYPTVYSVIVHSAYSDGQVASQAAVRAALTVQQSDGAASSRRSGADSSVQLLENSHDTSGQVQQNDIDQIGRAMVEATSRSQNVWRNAGRPGDDSEMVRQVGQLACQPASQPAIGPAIGPDFQSQSQSQSRRRRAQSIRLSLLIS
jgi:hypothetical protein